MSDCVKTCTRRERAELFSLFSSSDGDWQIASFLIQRNRDKLSTRKFDVGVFTQPGSKTEVAALERHVRSTLHNRHRQAAPPCPFRARKRHAGHPATMRLTRLGGRARSSQRARSRGFPRISGRAVSVALTPSLCLSANTWFPPFPRHRAAKPDFLFRCYSNPGL
jgi:hypothetical protein